MFEIFSSVLNHLYFYVLSYSLHVHLAGWPHTSRDARVVVLALTLTRMVSVVFGDMYFMIGHSIVYLCLTLMYAKYTIDRFLPLRSNESEQRDMMEGAFAVR